MNRAALKRCTGDEETRRVLRHEMRELFAENGRQMRILHEDVIAGIAPIREGQ
jgi:hypothetical protein